jgi:serine/threonine-protein kinase
MSVIYSARERHPVRLVALKVLAPELALDERFRRRFAHEARIASSLEHPNIVPVHHFGESNGMLWIAMRLIRGADLFRLIRNKSRLSLPETLSIIRQVASALDHAHMHSLVHRDVKPTNILVEESEGTESALAYLADFGAATPADGAVDFDQRHYFIGTFGYAAPEQIATGEADGRSDLYSLACVFYECLMGSPVFPVDSRAALLHVQHAQRIPSMRSSHPVIDARLDSVLRIALAVERKDRYRDCSSFVSAAESVAKGHGERATEAVRAGTTSSTPGAPRNDAIFDGDTVGDELT